MNYLLLIVSSIYTFIFYIFYIFSEGKSFFLTENIWNTYKLQSISSFMPIEIATFCFLSLFFFFYFWNFWTKKEEESVAINYKELQNFTIKVLKKYSYYIGFIFFYVSLFIIFKQLNISFVYIIFFINIFIFLLFFITNKFFISRDFIKINTILFSLYYIFFYIINISSWIESFIFIDFINSICIVIFFLLSLYSDKMVLKKDFSDTGITLYFFIYLFFLLSFYISSLFQNITNIVSIVGFLFFLILFFFIPKISLFYKNKVPIRITALFLNYISLIFGIVSLIFQEFDFFMFFIVFVSSLFNVFIHFRYTNSISFILWTIGSIFIVFQAFFEWYYMWIQDNIDFIVFWFFIAYILIILLYRAILKNIYDYYILNIHVYLVLIYSSIYFFFKNWFDIFHFWIILLCMSVWIFLSYNKINSLKIK